MPASHSAVAAAPEDLVLEIVRTFDAPRELVYRVWTEPAHARRWSAPEGLELTHCEMDVRVGGLARCCMSGAGGVEHWVTEVYQEVVENELLVFTHAWDDESGKPGPATTISVRFESVDGKTRVTMRQGGFATRASRDGHGTGWQECFDRLVAYLAERQGGAR